MDSIFGFEFLELQKDLNLKGFEKFRAGQIFKWIYCKKVNDFTKMTDISTNDRIKLGQIYDTSLLYDFTELVSKIDNTKKYLFRIDSKNFIESVFMVENKRVTVCLSSQTGCSLGCKFCATGKESGRDLTVDEIVRQFLTIFYNNPQRITNIVFMGMGEPLLNLQNLLPAIKIINSDKGINIGARKITVSTAGIIKGIEQLIKFPLQIKLAVSLNSAIQEKREKLMPVSKTNNIYDLKKILKDYQKIKNKRITFEYIILPGINDGKEDVEALFDYLKDIDCKLNIIPYNKTVEDFREPTEKEIKQFYERLSKFKNAVSIRKSKGKDINGACGQLRGKFIIS